MNYHRSRYLGERAQTNDNFASYPLSPRLSSKSSFKDLYPSPTLLRSTSSSVNPFRPGVFSLDETRRKQEKEIPERQSHYLQRHTSRETHAECVYPTYRRNLSKELSLGQITARSSKDDLKSHDTSEVPSRLADINHHHSSHSITKESNSIEKKSNSQEHGLSQNRPKDAKDKGNHEVNTSSCEDGKVDSNLEKEISTTKEDNDPGTRIERFPSKPLRRSAKSRKSFKRNRHKNATRKQSESNDPFDFIEIKSAAQWKSLTQRISWSVDNQEDPEEKEKDNSVTTKIIKVPKIEASGCITIKAPEAEMYPSSIDKTSLAQLRNICWRIKPWNEKKESRLFTSVYGQGWGVDCDEVVKGLYVGDKAAISNVAFLKKQGISQVLNAAEGSDEGTLRLI